MANKWLTKPETTITSFSIVFTFLKPGREPFPLMSEGINSQIFDVKKDADSVTWYTVYWKVNWNSKLKSMSNYNCSLHVI